MLGKNIFDAETLKTGDRPGTSLVDGSVGTSDAGEDLGVLAPYKWVDPVADEKAPFDDELRKLESQWLSHLAPQGVRSPSAAHGGCPEAKHLH